MFALVVGGDGNINAGQVGICVAESDNWDVHVASFLDGLVISAWVCDNQEARLLKAFLELIGEGTWGVATDG